MSHDPIAVIFADYFECFRLNVPEIGRLRCTCRCAAAEPVVRDRCVSVRGVDVMRMRIHTVPDTVYGITQDHKTLSYYFYGALISEHPTPHHIGRGKCHLIDNDIILPRYETIYRAKQCNVTVVEITICPDILPPGHVRPLSLRFIRGLNGVYLHGDVITHGGLTISRDEIKSDKVTFTRCRDPTATTILFLLGHMIYTSRYRYNENYCGETLLQRHMTQIEAKRLN